MNGHGAFKRHTKRREEKKRITKRAAKRAEKLRKTANNLPQISQIDLLAFQIAHFDDDSKPAEWFVNPETAKDLRIEAEDDLGYYSDGVKRTLSDANIDFFRTRELRQIAVEREEIQEVAVEKVEESHAAVSEIELADESTLGFEASFTTGTPRSHWQDRRRSSDIPYEERNKRRWEQYIAGEDAIQGSLTQRRIIRELDDQDMEEIDLDY